MREARRSRSDELRAGELYALMGWKLPPRPGQADGEIERENNTEGRD